MSALVNFEISFINRQNYLRMQTGEDFDISHISYANLTIPKALEILELFEEGQHHNQLGFSRPTVTYIEPQYRYQESRAEHRVDGLLLEHRPLINKQEIVAEVRWLLLPPKG